MNVVVFIFLYGLATSATAQTITSATSTNNTIITNGTKSDDIDVDFLKQLAEETIRGISQDTCSVIPILSNALNKCSRSVGLQASVCSILSKQTYALFEAYPLLQTLDVCAEQAFITNMIMKILDNPCLALMILDEGSRECDDSKLCPLVDGLLGEVKKVYNDVTEINVCSEIGMIMGHVEMFAEQPCSIISFLSTETCNLSESGHLLCTLVSFIQENVISVKELKTLDICGDLNIMKLIEHIISSLPCEVTKLFNSCEDESGLCFVVSAVKSTVEDMVPGISSINFCELHSEESEIISSLISLASRKPCHVMRYLNEKCPYNANAKSRMCFFFTQTIGAVKELVPFEIDLENADLCLEKLFVEDIIRSVRESPCSIYTKISKCNKNSLLCRYASSGIGYVLSNLSMYIPTQDLDLCHEQEVIMSLAEEVMTEPCNTFRIAYNKCNNETGVTCFGTRKGLKLLYDYYPLLLKTNYCFEQDFLWNIYRNITKNPCGVTEILSTASKQQCGNSTYCTLLSEVLLMTYITEGLPDIKTVNVCDESNLNFTTSLAYKIADNPCNFLEIIDCKDSDSDLCPYLRGAATVFKADDTINHMISVCKEQYWISEIYNNVCGVLEIAYNQVEVCKTQKSLSCPYIVPTMSLVNNTLPTSIRNLNICKDYGRLQELIIDTLRNPCAFVQAVDKTLIQECSTSEYGNYTLCQAMSMLEVMVSNTCEENDRGSSTCILNGVGEYIMTGLSVVKQIETIVVLPDMVSDVVNEAYGLLIILSDLGLVCDAVEHNQAILALVDDLIPLVKNISQSPCDVSDLILESEGACNGTDSYFCYVFKVVDLSIFKRNRSYKIDVCRYVPAFCGMVQDLFLRPCYTWYALPNMDTWSQVSLSRNVSFPAPRQISRHVVPLINQLFNLILEESCSLDEWLLPQLKDNLRYWQSSLQFMGWAGILPQKVVLEQQFYGLLIWQNGWDMFNIFSLSCSYPNFEYRTKLYNRRADFTYYLPTNIPETPRYRDTRNLIFTLGFDKYEMGTLWSPFQAFLTFLDDTMPGLVLMLSENSGYDVDFRGSSFFKTAYETFSHTFELSLYSQNPMSYETELILRNFMEYIGKNLVYKANLLKYGLIEAIGFSQATFPNIYVDMKSYYEPVCDICSDDVQTYQMMIFETDICRYNGPLLAKMAYDNADKLWPCVMNGRCKLRLGDCHMKENNTIVTWSLVGENFSKPYLTPGQLKDFLHLNETDLKFEVETFNNVQDCTSGHYTYVTNCISCPYNTYQNNTNQMFCNSCPGDAITYSTSSTCLNMCVYGRKHEATIWQEIELDACKVWQTFHKLNQFCSTKLKHEPTKWICGYITEYYQQATSGRLATGIPLIDKVASKEQCLESNYKAKVIKDYLALTLSVPSELVHPLLEANKLAPYNIPIQMFDSVISIFFEIIKNTDIKGIGSLFLQTEALGYVTIVQELSTLSDFYIKTLNSVTLLSRGVKLPIPDCDEDKRSQWTEWGQCNVLTCRETRTKICYTDSPADCKENTETRPCKDRTLCTNDTPCPAGQYKRTGRKCIPCPKNTYRSDLPDDKCLSCPENTFSPVQSTSKAACVSKVCDKGKSPDKEGNCQLCSAGFYSDTGVSCEPCKAGYYSKDSVRCLGCPVGYFSETSAEKCKKCDAGKTSPEKSTSVKDCVAKVCDKGKYADKGRGCKECAAGTYSPSGTSCEPCRAGYYSEEGAATCKPCDAGYHSEQGSKKCRGCPVGFYSQAGSSDCSACPKRTTSAEKSTSATACKPKKCDKGQFLDSEGVCKECDYGTFSESGTSCVKCKAGSYSKPGTEYCRPCPAGYHSAEGAGKCTKCPGGSFSQKGASSCYDLPKVTSVKITPKERMQISGETFRITCTIKANFKPGIEWTVIRKPKLTKLKVIPTDVETVATGVYRTVYELKNPTAVFSATYFCKPDKGSVRDMMIYNFIEKKQRVEDYYIKPKSDFQVVCPNIKDLTTSILVNDKEVMNSNTLSTGEKNNEDDLKNGTEEKEDSKKLVYTAKGLTDKTVIKCVSFKTVAGVETTVATIVHNVYMWEYTDIEQSVTVAPGDQVTVTCYLPVTKVKVSMDMKKDGNRLSTLAYKTETKDSVTKNGMEYDVIHWTLTHVDTAMYTCSTEIDKEVITSATVNVLVGAATISGGGVLDKKEVQLKCSGPDDSSATIKWFKDDKEVDRAEYSKDPEDGSDVLSVTLADDSIFTYTCQYNNDEALIATTQLIYADFVAPVKKLENTDDTISVICKYKSIADINVIWQKSLVPLVPSNKKEITTLTSDMNEITITRKKDADDYTVDTISISGHKTFELTAITCNYTLEKHKFSKAMTTIVWKRGFVKELPEFTYVSVGKYLLECQFASSYLPIKSSWKKNDQPAFDLFTRNEMISKNLISSKYPLKITDAITDKYECTFTDGDKQKLTSTTTLMFLKVEIINKDRKDGTIYPSLEKPTLLCKITAANIVQEKISWYRSKTKTKLPNDDTYGISFDNGVSTLTFKNFNTPLDDKYTCVYEVGESKAQDVANIFIIEISLVDTTEEYLDSYEPRTLTCTFHSAKKYDIHWFINGANINNYAKYHKNVQTPITGGFKSVLTISNFDTVDLPDKIRYWCSVKTGIGILSSKQKPFILRLIVPIPAAFVTKTKSSWDISCKLNGPSAPSSVTWYHGSTKLQSQALLNSVEGNNDPVLRYDISVVKDMYILSASSTSSTDSGKYSCSFTFKTGPVVQATIDVNIRIMTISQNLHQRYAQEDQVKLQCSITSSTAPSYIDWYKGKRSEQKIDSSKSEFKSTAGTYISEIIMQSIELADAGLYKCEALFDDNKNPTANTTIFVADLKPTNTQNHVSSGSTAELICKYTGSVEPQSVYWIKDGEIVKPEEGYISSRSEYKNNVLDVILRIFNIKPEQGGTFTCEVSLSKTLKIFGDPIIVSLSSVANINPDKNYVYVTDTGNAKLGCEFLGTNVPSPIKWYKGIQELRIIENVLEIENSDLIGNKMTSYITLTDPTLFDSGTYSCEFGTRKPPKGMELEVRQVIYKVSGQNDLLSEDSIKLTCSVKSVESCSTNWFKDGRFFKNNRQRKISQPNGVRMLTMTQEIPFQPGYFDGKYKCRISCQSGPSFTGTNFDIVHQHISTEKHAIVSTKNRFKRFCTYMGRKLPKKIIWYKNGDKIITDGKKYFIILFPPKNKKYKTMLKVKQASMDDDGEYSCSFEFETGNPVGRNVTPVMVVSLSGMKRCTTSSDTALVLSCVYSASSDFDDVKWYKGRRSRNVQEITEGIDKGKYLTKSRTSRLTLTNAESSVYKCVISVKSKDVVISTILQRVTLELSSSTTNVEVLPGTSVPFTCNIQKSMSDITWYDGETKLIKSNERVISLKSRASVLMYRVTSKSDISCRAITVTKCSESVTVFSNVLSFTVTSFTFLTNPQNTVIAERPDLRSMFYLSCSVPYDSSISLKWIEDSNKFAGFGKLSKTQDTLTSTRGFFSNRAANGYYCLATVGQSGTVIKSATATIMKTTYTIQPTDSHSVDNNWIAFKCAIPATSQLTISLVKYLDKKKVSVGIAEMSYATVNGEIISTGIIKIDNTAGKAGKYQCLVTLDDGDFLSDTAKLVNGVISTPPLDQWVSIGGSVEFAIMTTFADDHVSWHKSSDEGVTWTGVVTSDKILFFDSFTIHSLKFTDIKADDAAMYKVIVKVDAGELNAGGIKESNVVSLKLRRIAEITYNIPFRTDDSKPQLNDQTAFTCKVISDIQPTSILWKWMEDAHIYRSGVLQATNEANTYLGTGSGVVKHIQNQQISCKASFGLAYPVIIKSYDFSPDLGCEQPSAKANSKFEFYTLDGVDYAKIKCVGDNSVIVDKSDEITTCNSQTGKWASSLTYCQILTPPKDHIELAISFSTVYCTNDEQITEIAAKGNKDDTECGILAAVKKSEVSCYTSNTCVFDENKTTCKYDAGTGKMVLSGFFKYTGAATGREKAKEDIQKSYIHFTFKCSTDKKRKKRKVSDTADREILLNLDEVEPLGAETI